MAGIFDIFKREQTAPAARIEPIISYRRGVTMNKQNSSYIRSFEMAKSDKAFNSWTRDTRPIDSILRQYIRSMRARSRDLARNNPYMKRFVSMLKTNVIGADGIRLQMKVKGGDGFDRELNNLIESEWKSWGKKGRCTVDGRSTFLEFQRQVISNLAVDGEVLIWRGRSAAGGKFGSHGYQQRFINPDLLDEMINRDLPGGNFVRMGIEMDSDDRVVAYHLRTSHPADDFLRARREKIIRVPASEIIHIFLQNEVDQSRGAPWVYASARRLRMLDGYEEAELIAARIGAMKIGFYKSPDGSFGPDDASDEELGDCSNDQPDLLADLEPGSFYKLAAGQEVDTFDPKHPVEAFADFVRFMLLGIGAGLDIPYHSITGDLTKVNYSSIRAGELEAREIWRALQSFLIGHWLEETFEQWFSWGLIAGAPRISELSATRIEEIIAASQWRPRGWAWVDPAKEASGKEKELALGVTSRTRIAAERGMDFEEIIEELAAETKLAASLGIDFSKTPTPDAPSTDEKDDEEDEDDQSGDGGSAKEKKDE